MFMYNAPIDFYNSFDTYSTTKSFEKKTDSLSIGTLYNTQTLEKGCMKNCPLLTK